MRLGIIIGAVLMGWSGLAAAQGPTVSIKDPAAFVRSLAQMGYKVTPLKPGDKPEFDVTIDDFVTTLRFVGCTAGHDCKYITLVASYNDVIDPPAAWLQKMNDEFDMLKVGMNDRHEVYLFAAHAVEGLPVTTLKQIFDYWLGDAGALADEAKKAKVVTPPKT